MFTWNIRKAFKLFTWNDKVALYIAFIIPKEVRQTTKERKKLSIVNVVNKNSTG